MSARFCFADIFYIYRTRLIYTMRYFLQFSYDGTAYHGWQVQPNADTVQQRLDRALALILRQPVETVGAGRTDTGVHADMMVAHFDVDQTLDTHAIVHKLNRVLPQDIAVRSLRPVRDDAHARFDATARTYHYYVYTQKNPRLRHFALQLFFTPDYALMNAAAEQLLSVTDFTSFSKLHTDARTNICHVSHARWVQVDADLWRFEITANRFLRNMVRAVVGTLLEVGRHRLSLDDFRQIIERKDRCEAGDSVAARALSLVHIAYPESLFL